MRKLFEEAKPTEVFAAAAAPAMPLPVPVPEEQEPFVPAEPEPLPQETEDEQTGTLIVEVTTARGAVPLKGVTVVIDRIDMADPQGRKELIRVEETGTEGRTRPVTLPTANKDLSLEPGNADPFNTVYVSARERGFDFVRDRPVDVFTGEKSILKIDLVPTPEDLTEGTVLGW